MSLLSLRLSARHCWGLCSSGLAGPAGRGEESPEALQAAGHQVGRATAAPGAGPRSSHVAGTLWGCRKARPSPTGTVQMSHQPQRSPQPLATPRVCSSGNPEFICQIQDTTLTVPGFSFCLSLIASGRALLKGKWCVLTGQGPPPEARKRLPQVALPSVSQAQPPYPNGKAASPGCVSASTGHVGPRGRVGLGPGHRIGSLAGGVRCQPRTQSVSLSFHRAGAAGCGLVRRGVGRFAASERGQEEEAGLGTSLFWTALLEAHTPRGLGRNGVEIFIAHLS